MKGYLVAWDARQGDIDGLNQALARVCRLEVSPVELFRMPAAIDKGAVPEASGVLQRIRLVVATNLILGLVTVVVGATGRYW
jgi:uncharacterized membrane protein